MWNLAHQFISQVFEDASKKREIFQYWRKQQLRHLLLIFNLCTLIKQALQALVALSAALQILDSVHLICLNENCQRDLGLKMMYVSFSANISVRREPLFTAGQGCKHILRICLGTKCNNSRFNHWKSHIYWLLIWITELRFPLQFLWWLQPCWKM